MHAFRRRKKKLILAFHFCSSDPAGWNCGRCRAEGLERRRHCGWLQLGNAGDKDTIVWAKGKWTASRCPKSLLTAESLNWLEMFWLWQSLGMLPVAEPAAKDLEALAILANELEKQKNEPQ